ncbi:hypothetical protein IM793_15150 [Pedobacter sp. MR2016-19]|uniref:hypothetical protein n=1 Tax=Pedobacter sp. MR2016-19 TaxID=2780089 RepID=UPI0018772566|nr:hypothetical protein [Pedobacter sp. MR2016-19]MBE5320502.1 hypothetical protein [Pedobacter sp. MR2016-19]
MFLLVFAFLSCTSKTADQEKKLIGKWVGDLIDYKIKINLGKMYLEFTTDGNFLQTSVNGKEHVTSKMTYRINKDKIFYKGKATGNEEFDLNYHFKGDNLILTADGNSEPYSRIK